VEDCIFCAIREKGLGSALYNDDACFAILDKFPAERGHVLVISKAHSADMIAAPEQDVVRSFAVAKRFAALCREKLNATGVSVITNVGKDAGQIVPHFHVHVIPKYPPGQREMRYNSRMEITPDDTALLTKLLSIRH
jgi:histidine triad (HIT) family protein